MTDHASSTQKQAKGDERNVVAVDPAAPQATLEERLAKFWTENRTVLIIGVVLVIAVIIGRSVWQGQVAAKQHAVRAAFGQAETAEAKLAFAREHDDSPLAGVAVLTAADEAYSAADYATASQRYGEAAKLLTDPLIRARARLGEAVSTLQGGTADKGEQLLRAVGNDGSAPEAIRAEAWYHLAAHLNATGELTGTREALAKVSEVSPRGLWSMRAAALSAKLPPETNESAPTP